MSGGGGGPWIVETSVASAPAGSGSGGGGERQWSPKACWRIMRDGGVWMETSDEDEVRAEAARLGLPVEQLWQERPRQQWRASTGEGDL